MDYPALAQRHALTIIVALLLVVPVAAWLAWTHAVRRPSMSAPGVAIATFLPTAFGAAVFITIATRIAHGSAFASADQRVLDAVRDGVPAAAAHWFGRVTHLGDPWFLTLLCACACVALLLARRAWLAVYLAAVTGGGALINHALKSLMGRARPSGALVPLPESFAFPSGHTFGSIVCYGMCAYMLMRIAPTRWDPLIVALACLFVLAISASRIVIGVHFPGDVIGGFAAGGAWLALCIGVAELARRRMPIP